MMFIRRQRLAKAVFRFFSVPFSPSQAARSVDMLSVMRAFNCCLHEIIGHGQNGQVKVEKQTSRQAGRRVLCRKRGIFYDWASVARIFPLFYEKFHLSFFHFCDRNMQIRIIIRINWFDSKRRGEVRWGVSVAFETANQRFACTPHKPRKKKLTCVNRLPDLRCVAVARIGPRGLVWCQWCL